MKRKLEIITCVLLSGSLSASAQSISPEVIASAGQHFENGSSQLSWTLGEIAIETYAASGNIITQGFHQTQLTVTTVEETSSPSIDVSVFPNPTSQLLNIRVSENHPSLLISLFDMHGKLIMDAKMGSSEKQVQLNVSQLAMANYILRIKDQNGSCHSTHKINKTAP